MIGVFPITAAKSILFTYARLEEISGAASKEYLLEKNLGKMKAEWSDMSFEFVQYRDTVSLWTPS